MSLLHETDSEELAELRAGYHSSHWQTATARRLGAYAREHGITITDFGAHSSRWIALFNRK